MQLLLHLKLILTQGHFEKLEINWILKVDDARKVSVFAVFVKKNLRTKYVQVQY